jgi:hypothetical protein
MKQSNWKDTAELVGIAAIVLGLGLVAYELRQNTMMMQSQTRDSMTEKQMMFSEWVATNRYTAEVMTLAAAGELEPNTPEYNSFLFLNQGIFREWENSFYQYQQGLFEPEEFEPRRDRWRRVMTNQPVRDYWQMSRDEYSPGFRKELDEIFSQTTAAESTN